MAEGFAVVFLILVAGGLTVFAEPMMRYATATAASLHAPRPYIDAVMEARPRPGPTSLPGELDEVAP
jgi:multicomponent K+:H+ antiporter subunit D